MSTISSLVEGIQTSKNIIKNKMIAANQATANDNLSTLAANLDIGAGKLPDYEGSYQITPRVTEQVLATKNTSLTDNLTVLQIPYASVTNLSGGLTVTIGLE